MLRRSLLMTLFLALLAGPAFGRLSSPDPACEAVMGMTSDDCGSEHGMAANPCTAHCAAAVGIVAAVRGIDARPAAALPIATAVLPAGVRGSPPDTAPPKA
jgi:hypothetical protein